MSIEDSIRQGFERLQRGDLKVTSDKTVQYNCIAWAMGDAARWWWPESDGYWPPGAPRAATVEAFTAAFATVGFAPCDDGRPVAGQEKVVLYTKNGKPTHASFLKAPGEWSSKLGQGHDVSHRTENCIGGRAYGEPTHYFQRPTPSTPRPVMSNLMAELAEKYGATNEAEKARAPVVRKSSKGRKPQ